MQSNSDVQHNTRMQVERQWGTSQQNYCINEDRKIELSDWQPDNKQQLHTETEPEGTKKGDNPTNYITRTRILINRVIRKKPNFWKFEVLFGKAA